MKKIKAKTALSAEEMGGEQPPFEVGQEVTIVQAPAPDLVGQTGTIVSAHCGQYYAVDVAGVVSYLPDASLGGERPAMAGGEEPPPPTEEPAPVVAPPAAAQALAAGGPTVAGQLEVMKLAALGRDVLARTKAQSADAALLAIEAALVAAEKVPALSARVAELEAAKAQADASADLKARVERLTAALRSGALSARSQAFEDGSDTPRAVWLRGSVEDLDATLATLSVGAAPVVQPKAEPDRDALASADQIPPEVAEHCRARGITDQRKIQALTRAYNRGRVPQEQTR